MASADGPASDRLDRWIWHARFVKTRGIAQKLIRTGGVRLNGQRCESPAARLAPGDVLTLSLPSRVLVVEVRALTARRGPATEAATLYRDRSAGR